MNKKRRRRRRQAVNAFEVGKIKVVSSSSVTLTKGGMGEKVGPANNSTLLREGASQVNHDIARGKSKSAVEKAKQLHKLIGTDDSEALLVGAYFARIQGMLETGLSLEARELMTLVERRYRSAADRFQDLRLSLNIQTGQIDEFAAILSDPKLSSGKREVIELAIKRELTDLSSLASCDVLTIDHPLRQGAAGLFQALKAVTSGPVEDSEIMLREISRRSPLAEWKTLVRALACFYRRDDEACLKLLDAMDSDSAAARLVPALRAMINPEDQEEKAALKPEASRLVKAVRSGNGQVLRDSLRTLDLALAENKRRRLPDLIRQTVRLCKKTHPDLLEQLKQHISIRCVLLEVPVQKVIAAMGGPSRHDAYFWRLYARAMEVDHQRGVACSLWEEFRRNAVHEGWFAENGPEVRALYLHMIDLLRQIPAESLDMVRDDFEDDFGGYGIYYEDQPAEVKKAAANSNEKVDFYFLYPEKLYERAAACQADSELFGQWLDYARKENSRRKTVDDIAQRWHQVLPQDSQPLLHLMESAEQRNAFDKALTFLEKAEQLDRLNPEVKRARLRLLVSKALRHLKQRKPHLLEKDLTEMAQWPLAQEGDRPAFLTGLKWAGAQCRDHQADSTRFHQETCELMGGQSAGIVVLMVIVQAGDLASNEMFSLDKSSLKRHAELVQAVARGCRLGDDLSISFEIPQNWVPYLIKGLSKKDCQLDILLLQSLAEAAWRRDQNELAFAVSRLGLQRGGPGKGWFMFLRARILSICSIARMKDCLAAAAELARRQGDMNLLAKVVDFGQSGNATGRFGLSYRVVNSNSLQVDDKELTRIMELEESAAKLPKFSAKKYLGDIPLDDYNSECDCPSCRRRRGETGPKKRRKRRSRPPEPSLFNDLDLYEDDEEDYEDDFEQETVDDSGDFPPDSIPTEIMEFMLELFMKNGGQMPDSRELDRIAREDPDFGLRMEQVLAAMESGRYDPPPNFDDDPYELPEISLPATVKTSRKERRQKRKKARKNRK